MTESTEETVRDVIVAAMRAKYAELGFATAPGNVRDYLADFHHPEQLQTYLIADTDNGPRVRAWGIDVIASDDWFASGNQIARRYIITVRGYESLGQDGEGVKALVAYERKAREAIVGLSSRLSGTVSQIDSVSSFSRTVQPTPFDAVGGFMVVGTRTYEAIRVHPDF